jgi:hypothetical protein
MNWHSGYHVKNWFWWHTTNWETYWPKIELSWKNSSTNLFYNIFKCSSIATKYLRIIKSKSTIFPCIRVSIIISAVNSLKVFCQLNYCVSFSCEFIKIDRLGLWLTLFEIVASIMKVIVITHNVRRLGRIIIVVTALKAMRVVVVTLNIFY